MNGQLRPAIFLANFPCVHALVHEPKLIVCDELTGNLHYATGGRENATTRDDSSYSPEIHVWNG